MAECQATYHYNPNNMLALKSNLSQPRFNTFQSLASSDAQAFEYYLYNARLSKSFLFPLHVIEVTVRNAIDSILCSDFSSTWPVDASFTGILSKESNETLSNAIQRATLANKMSRDDIVARLTFDFWSNLFRSEYDRPLWQTRMSRLTPNDQSITRSSFQKEISKINHFRNRIAHHEPILGENISVIHSTIIQIVNAISKETAAWLRAHSTVMKIMRTSPDKSLRQVVATICDKSFAELDGSTTIKQAIQKADRFFVVNDIDINTDHVFDRKSIADYISQNLVDGDIIDLRDHTVSQLAISLPTTRAVVLQHDAEVLDLAEKFKKSNSDFAAIFNNGKLIGIIAKSHRRY